MSQDIPDEKEIAEVEEFFQKPAYQMTYREALYTAHRLKEIPDLQQKKAEIRRFARDENFLFRFSHDYFFYRFVRRKEMKKEWYWNQIREIGYLILLDLLHPENAFPTKAEKKPKKSAITSGDSLSNWLSDRQLRRIRKNYPEIFFTPSTGKARRSDKRFTRFSTIFSDMPLENDEDWPVALQLLAAQDQARLPIMGVIDELRQTVTGLRMVDPDEVAGLEKFWEMEKRSLEIVTANFKQPTDNNWMIPHIKKGTVVVENMYQLIDQAVALRWYRTIKSREKKERLFREKYPWRYTREDAKRAVESTFRWFKDPVQATDIVFRGASAYGQMGMFDVELSLYAECLKQPLEAKDSGLCCHNIAFTYRMMNKPRKYLIWLKKALEVFENDESLFDVGVTWSFIAEAYYLLGEHEEYEDAVRKSKSVLYASSLTDYQLAQAYLCMADCAMRIRNRTWEREALVSGFRAASKLDDLDYAVYFSQRIGDLDAGRWTCEAEQEPGKLQHPPIFRWYKDPVRYLALTPRSHELRKSDEKYANSKGSQ